MERDIIKIITRFIQNDYDLIYDIFEDKKILNELRTYLRNNNISGFFYSRCRNADFIDKLPIRFREEITNRYEKQRIFNNLLFDEIINLNHIFRNNGIEAIFLKGPVFSLKYYGDIGERSISDIDILTENKKDVYRTDKILKDNGYTLKSNPIFGNKLTFLFTHHYEYEKDDFKLDLHWVLQSHFSYKIDYKKIWSEKMQYKTNGTYIYILSDEYELLFRIISIFIDIQLGTIRFKSIIDLYMLVNILYQETDWGKFLVSRSKENLDRITINILDLLITVFDANTHFAELYRIINNNHSKITLKNDNEKLELLNSTPFSYQNRIWALRSYNTCFLKAFAWWIISIPVKFSIYRTVFLKPFKKLLG